MKRPSHPVDLQHVHGSEFGTAAGSQGLPLYVPPSDRRQHPTEMGRRHTLVNYKTLYIVLAVLVFGIVLTMLNVYELRRMQSYHFGVNHGQGFGIFPIYPEAGAVKKTYWVSASHSFFQIGTGYLKHVFGVLDRLGFKSSDGSSDWTVLWSHDYPFGNAKLQNALSTLKPHQKVNKFPGSGVITNKNSLATSPIRNIPTAFKLPFDKEKLLEHAKKYPDKMWVQKSNSHRGIKIKKLQEIDLTKAGTFVQEYVSKPYLIDGRKFDLGIYTTMTSIDPLRVYVFDGDFLIRFCPKDYYPFDEADVDKYVVGDDYTPTWEMPSLMGYYTDMSYTFKETFQAYLHSKGENFERVMKDMYDTIRDVYVQKEKHFITAAKEYPSKENFFEMVRFDFVLDKDLKVYLMEVNMSPNLSSGHFKANALLYEQVLLNLFSIIGLAGTASTKEFVYSAQPEADMRVSDRDIQVTSDVCASQSCSTCSSPECVTCHKCLSNPQRASIKKAFLEHVNKRSMKRLFPPTMTQEEAKNWKPGSDDDYQKYNDANKMMFLWFRGKCLQHATWCH